MRDQISTEATKNSNTIEAIKTQQTLQTKTKCKRMNNSYSKFKQSTLKKLVQNKKCEHEMATFVSIIIFHSLIYFPPFLIPIYMHVSV